MRKAEPNMSDGMTSAATALPWRATGRRNRMTAQRFRNARDLKETRRVCSPAAVRDVRVTQRGTKPVSEGSPDARNEN